jgi:hypothetical protein
MINTRQVIIDPDLEVQYQSVVNRLHDDLLAANMRANWAIDQIGKYVKEIDFLKQELYNERKLREISNGNGLERTHGKEEAR